MFFILTFVFGVLGGYYFVSNKTLGIMFLLLMTLCSLYFLPMELKYYGL